MAQEAISSIIQYLPIAIETVSDINARDYMAWADMLAGLCIANAGKILPHAIAMSVGGYFPQVMHGETLAIVYPEFIKCTYEASIKKFAYLGRILNPELVNESDENAALKSCELMNLFLKKIGMWLSFEGFGISRESIQSILDYGLKFGACLDGPGDVTSETVYEILVNSYSR